MRGNPGINGGRGGCIPSKGGRPKTGGPKGGGLGNFSDIHKSFTEDIKYFMDIQEKSVYLIKKKDYSL